MIRCYNCGSEDAFHEPDCPDVLNAEVRRAVKAAVHDMQERLVAACERMAAAESRATREAQLADALVEGMKAVKEWVNRKEVVGLAEVAHFHGYTISTEFWEAHGKPAWDKFNEALAQHAAARRGTP